MVYLSLHIVIGVYRCSHTIMDGILYLDVITADLSRVNGVYRFSHSIMDCILYLEVITAELSPICVKRVLS